jgi:hypothetical protein
MSFICYCFITFICNEGNQKILETLNLNVVHQLLVYANVNLMFWHANGTEICVHVIDFTLKHVWTNCSQECSMHSWKSNFIFIFYLQFIQIDPVTGWETSSQTRKLCLVTCVYLVGDSPPFFLFTKCINKPLNISPETVCCNTLYTFSYF